MYRYSTNKVCNVLDFFYYHLAMKTSGKETREENTTKTKRLVHNLFKVWFILLIQFLLNTDTHECVILISMSTWIKLDVNKM